jgi:hypothetical protein
LSIVCHFFVTFCQLLVTFLSLSRQFCVSFLSLFFYFLLIMYLGFVMAPAVQSEVPFVSLRFFLNNVSRFCYGPGGSIRSSICISLFFLNNVSRFCYGPGGSIRHNGTANGIRLSGVASRTIHLYLFVFFDNVSRFCYGPGGSIRRSICRRARRRCFVSSTNPNTNPNKMYPVTVRVRVLAVQ